MIGACDCRLVITRLPHACDQEIQQGRTLQGRQGKQFFHGQRVGLLRRLGGNAPDAGARPFGALGNLDGLGKLTQQDPRAE